MADADAVAAPPPVTVAFEVRRRGAMCAVCRAREKKRLPRTTAGLSRRAITSDHSRTPCEHFDEQNSRLRGEERSRTVRYIALRHARHVASHRRRFLSRVRDAAHLIPGVRADVFIGFLERRM